MNTPTHILNSSTITQNRNKKLQHEYSGFEYKVGYFLLTSTYKGKVYFKNEIDPVYMKCPDSEVNLVKTKIEAVKKKLISPGAMTINRWNDHLQNFYTLYRQINLGLESDKPKRNILVRLKEMFDDDSFDASIIVYTGPATFKGGILVETKEFGTEEIFFSDVLTQWNKKTSKQKHLLIILDCNYSGKWATDFNNHPDKIETVSIFASCRENQKAAYFDLGMYFTYNIMKYLTKSQSENIVNVSQIPIFIGDYLDCKKYTNLFLNFSNWNSLLSIQKSDYAMIEYDNGTYIGHIESGQKQYWGVFVWKNGIFKNCKYIGEFQKGKLEGKGIMVYTNGRVYEGEFKNNAPDGLAVESYENGDKYIGKFSKGFKSGYGVYVYSNNQIYEGEFKDNKPWGKGRLIISKNSFYEGNFSNGKCNGQGKYKYPNGDTYEGQWVESVKHGKGKYLYSNGDIYEGEFVNGYRHGKGKLKMSSGQVYEGGWENDVMCGEGKYATGEEQVIGEWIKGKIDKKPIFFSKVGTHKISSEI